MSRIYTVPVKFRFTDWSKIYSRCQVQGLLTGLKITVPAKFGSLTGPEITVLPSLDLLTGLEITVPAKFGFTDWPRNYSSCQGLVY